MKEVIPPVDRELIERELTEDKFLRKTNNSKNLLYVITHHDSPNIMQEIGRLREVAFREAGGGTGKDVDIDKYDTSENPYSQLIVWDPEIKEILGGYRFIICSDLPQNKDISSFLATSRLFIFSDKFKNEYLPYTIELGRSFVQPMFQSTRLKKKSVYVLDNLWDGLGAIWIKNQKIKYFFGKVTMYTSYNEEARNLILYFLNKHFSDSDDLLTPLHALELNLDENKIKSILKSDNYVDDLKILSQEVRARGEVIPPLINAYINLSPTMRCFGTVLNTHFGDVEETAIMVTQADMYPAKIERHIKSFKG
jgi:hypothetical protein